MKMKRLELIFLTSTKLDYERSDAGICYDEIQQTVYVGGGTKGDWISDDYRGVKAYDIMKEEWLDLPETWMKHKYKPIMWNDRHNHNLLFIGSVYQNSLEFMDLRENRKSWKIIRDMKYTEGLSEIFGFKSFNRAILCVSKY